MYSVPGVRATSVALGRVKHHVVHALAHSRTAHIPAHVAREVRAHDVQQIFDPLCFRNSRQSYCIQICPWVVAVGDAELLSASGTVAFPDCLSLRGGSCLPGQ